MDNHLHLLLRLDSCRVRVRSDEEVARRWLTLFPIRDLEGESLAVLDERGRRFSGDFAWIAAVRKRLSELGWFIKRLKEPLARRANREGGCTGAFWEGRFRSVPVRDQEVLLAVAADIDLNPFAAGAAETPEARGGPRFASGSPPARCDGPTTAAMKSACGCRRRTTAASPAAIRLGPRPHVGLAFGTGRRRRPHPPPRDGKAALPRAAASIFVRRTSKRMPRLCHGVDRENFPRYLAGYEFRYNRRDGHRLR
ncbi:hypothetical protein [Planctomyces sp. SH-PL62]|uniref:hypothetical protein n=1 Tax=Planctomyces sp. SH-PL62 TaxID=1636152 RepID=UPI00078DEF83|nr:hypothetical protein [Planctomyces sp. SH-PL62]AMV38205.1 hypothetical protein VT85_12260 [Planctomyces sp. SH-PL62]